MVSGDCGHSSPRKIKLNPSYGGVFKRFLVSLVPGSTGFLLAREANAAARVERLHVTSRALAHPLFNTRPLLCLLIGFQPSCFLALSASTLRPRNSYGRAIVAKIFTALDALNLPLDDRKPCGRSHVLHVTPEVLNRFYLWQGGDELVISHSFRFVENEPCRHVAVSVKYLTRFCYGFAERPQLCHWGPPPIVAPDSRKVSKSERLIRRSFPVGLSALRRPARICRSR
jgi:hypothetical protein